MTEDEDDPAVTMQPIKDRPGLVLVTVRGEEPVVMTVAEAAQLVASISFNGRPQ